MDYTKDGDDFAAEHGALRQDGDGWYTAALVACAIEKGAGSGKRNDLGAGRPEVEEDAIGQDGQVSTRRYAEKSGISVDTVKRILRAWNGQAEKGVVPASEDLKPSDLPRVVAALPSEAEHPWKKAYTGLSRNETSDQRRRAANSDPTTLVAEMTPEQREAVVNAVATVQPDAVANVVKARPDTADALQRAAGPELFDAQGRVRKEKVFDHQIGVIAGGGKITRMPTPEEAFDEHPTMNAFIAQTNLLNDAEKYAGRAYECVVDARGFGEFIPDQEKRVQRMALHLLEALDKETTE